MQDHDDNKPSDDAGGTLKRRGDNVGQSARYTRQEDPGKARYGHEERFHSTEHQQPGGAAEPPPAREPNADKPNATQYEGGFAPRGEGGEAVEGQSQPPSGGYGDAGGEIAPDMPNDPENGRWKGKGGAGFGENYGSARERKEDDIK